MPRKMRDEDIPIKIGVGGWNGKFVYEKPMVKPGYTVVEKKKPYDPNKRPDEVSSTSGSNSSRESQERQYDHKQYQHEQHHAQYNGRDTEGFHPQSPPKEQYYYKPDQNWSNTTNFYGYSNEPTILPVQWDGTFAKGSDVRMQPERNRSDQSKFYGFSTEPEVLPVQWSGKFEMDPNDVRIKPERNFSDVRDYAEANRFVCRNQDGNKTAN